MINPITQTPISLFVITLMLHMMDFILLLIFFNQLVHLILTRKWNQAVACEGKKVLSDSPNFGIFTQENINEKPNRPTS